MAEVSEAARATRRRALGRRLRQKASQIRVDVEAVRGADDLQFLGDKEGQLLSKTLTNLEKMVNNLDKIGTSLDK